ncbi:PP2C family protein-serine/threonine phosphatase [Actinoallomurus rhizosphaericola]|uniref:PP2C family protein-serine/threonine phosphatase n=1 Tax=Actinoallomurus rhizosphaericola TaxID=2952536 RepID=UPI002090B821|nr:PP2C family protein-serine/threonine phosphatase [Actinoallomurus rhizosphaericola]MCO5994312.1 serine/threonine-protein phosphatase [Actinoallomurus rhizosphaericola]
MTGVWAAAPHPVVVADGAGRVVELNEAAARLFPRAEPGASLAATTPGWLAEAHRAAVASGTVDEPVRGEAGEYGYEARATFSPDGDVIWWLVEDTDRRRAETALETERRRTALLIEAAGALLTTLNYDRCMEVAVRLAAEHLADAAILVAPATGKRLPVAYAIRGAQVSRRTLRADPAEVPGLSEALQGFPPIPSRWIDPGRLPSWAVPEGFGGSVGAVAVTPLPGHGIPAGALILLRRSDRRGFGDDEEVFARLFAARAGAALSAARVYADRTGITEILMRELLPPRLRHVHGVAYAGGYRASVRSELVGGDFYDVHPGEDEETESLVVLGDVCGKGLEAAVTTGRIRTTLQALLPLAGDHLRTLSLLNGALLNSGSTRFATLVLASAVRAGDRVRLRLTSAGHPPPLIVRRDGVVEEAATRGTLIGAFPDVQATTAGVELAPGETCVLYTDGITEARGGPLGDIMFGEERLKDALSECAGMPAEGVVERVQMLAAEWAGDRDHDDMAVVAISAPQAGRPEAAGRRPRGEEIPR